MHYHGYPDIVAPSVFVKNFIGIFSGCWLYVDRLGEP